MLYLIPTLLILIPTLAGIGQFTLRKIPMWEGLGASLVAGIMSVSVTWTILSFFIPINLYIEIITIFLGISLFFYQKLPLHFIKFLKENSLSFFPILGIILFFGSFAPFILDHFGYYVPTILIIKKLGIIQGIANADYILGQMSIWHIFQAGFSHFSDPFFKINTLLLTTYLIYFLEKKNYLHLLFFPILFLFIQSPSPDLPVIILSLILVNEILTKNKNLNALFLIGAFIFIIKPTAIWTLLLPFFYGIFILKRLDFRWILGGSFLCILFCIKNLWTFGFPIYPMSILDFGLDWKPNPELLKQSSEIAILKTYDMQFSYAEIQKFSFWDYIKHWIFLKGIKSKIHILFIISILSFCIFCYLSKKKIFWFICISLIIKTILVLGFSAQYRFFLEVFFIIFFIIFYEKFNKRLIFITFSIISLGIGFILSNPKFLQNQIPSFYVGQFMNGFRKKQWLKPAGYQLNKYKKYQIGNLKFNTPYDYPLSFDTPPIAITKGLLKSYLQLGIFPQQKTNDARDGFYWRKLSHSEKDKLQKIIELYDK